jgi:hypothetical protein
MGLVQMSLKWVGPCATVWHARSLACLLFQVAGIDCVGQSNLKGDGAILSLE